MLNKNCNDSVYCVTCADRHVFCTDAAMAKAKAMVVEDEHVTGMELGRHHSPCIINGTLAPPNTPNYKHQPKYRCEYISILTIRNLFVKLALADFSKG